MYPGPVRGEGVSGVTYPGPQGIIGAGGPKLYCIHFKFITSGVKRCKVDVLISLADAMRVLTTS